MKRVLYARQLADRIARDPNLESQIKSEPEKVIRQYSEPAYVADKWIYRMVVGILGLAIVIAAGGALWLAVRGGGPTPEILLALGSAAVGALAGLLAPSPTQEI